MELKDLTDVEYIGDAVYVGKDGWQVWLVTYNGMNITNKIALEPEVLQAFDLWRKRHEQ